MSNSIINDDYSGRHRENPVSEHGRFRALARLRGSRAVAGAVAACALSLFGTPGPALAALPPDTVRTGNAAYGADGDAHGRCGFPEGSAVYLAAVSAQHYRGAQACGAHLLVTSKATSRSVHVKVTDQCAGCGADDLLLNPAAFQQIASLQEGRIAITWKLTDAQPSSGMFYRFRPGSNKWWGAFQVDNSRFPIARVEILRDGTWANLPRGDDNYFTATSAGPGPHELRLTDVYGATVIEQQVPLLEGGTHQGNQQFPQR